MSAHPENKETRDTDEERYLPLFFHNSPLAMALVDTDGNVIMANEADCHFLGYSQEELIGMHFSKFTYPEDLTIDLALYDSLRAGDRGHYSIEKRYIRKDGTIVWGRLHVSLIRGESKYQGYTIILCEDITHHKKTEERMKDSEEKLRIALRSANAGAWSWDMATNKSIWSDENYQLLGHVPGSIEACYKSWINAVHPDDRAKSELSVSQTIKNKSDLDIEFRVVWPDGTIRWIKDIGKIVCDESGKPTGMYGLQIDITDKKITEEELQKSQKLEAIGILAGGIAHDFNNLLTAITNNLYLIKKQLSNDSDEHNRIITVEKAIAQASDLTQQLMTFSKGGLPVKETASIVRIIKETSAFLVRGSKSKCEYIIPDGIWPVNVDVGQVSQVIQNLIINADQSMPEGGTIRITLENSMFSIGADSKRKDGKYVKITVQDEGVGIQGEHLTRIFDPYFSTKKEGRGFGLATAYSIVKKHDGNITVYSSPGEGTTFIVYLPASEEKKITGPDTELSDTSYQAKARRILIMDDEKMIRDSLADILCSMGYECETAHDGKQAIEMYRSARESSKPFDAVIIDLTIPGGMGGKETIGKLLEIDPHARVIVSSGYSDDPIMANYRDYGFKGVLRKPYHDIRDLVKTLHNAMEGIH